jgi:predicted ArsR family transcriptional regulator
MPSFLHEIGYDAIHIWQFPKGTTVKIPKEFIYLISSSRKQQGKTVGLLYRTIKPDMPFSCFKNQLGAAYPNFYDLHTMLKVVEVLKIPREELEKKVVAYRFAKSRIVVENPFLPVKISPIFPMIIAHMIADGNIVRFKNKKTIYFSYRQYNSKLRLSMIDKIQSLFGQVKYKRDYFTNGTRIYIPEVLTLILSQYYGLKHDSYLSKTALLPEEIMNGSPNDLLAVLIAFIVDEGWIDSTNIGIKLKNPPLVQQLAKICNKIGYSCSTSFDQKTKMANIYILRDSLTSFWADYSVLKEKFPCITLGPKEDKLKIDLDCFSKMWKSKGSGETKNNIIKLLKNQPMTNWELAEKLTITRQGIRNHTKFLQSKGILSCTKVKESAFLYKLEKEITFAESEKGQSLPIGETARRIKDLLKKSPRTTIEIIKAIPVEKSTIRRILNRCQEKGEVILLKKVPTKTMPTKLWELPTKK